jgi:lipopolysaccharide export system permease protein
MKKLDQFILKSFIGPFIAILLVVVFILVMQFLWLYIDELVGKGLSLKVILEFLGWGSVTMLPLSLPLATLLASMMTLGTLGQNNELLAIKAAGVSLQRVLMPLGAACLVVSIGAFFISNDLMPVAFNKIYTLRDDIGKTKEEIKIPTGTFYNGIEGYILRVNERNDETGVMHGVMVYNHTGNKGNTSLTIADSAMMKMSKDKSYLTFTLYDGANYEETNTKNYRDTTLQLQKIDFSCQELYIPLENYAFEKSDSARFDDEVKSMNLKQLYHGQDSIGNLNA